MLSKANRSGTVYSLESSGAEGWTLERREYVEDDENNSVSQSDESEENEIGVPMIEEYDEQQIPGYRRDNSESSPLQMMDDGSEDNDDDAEGDEEGDDGEDYEAEDVGDDDDDVDMGGDGDDDDDDDGGDGVANADVDDGATSYSSGYSE
jgi:hypothetical protein